MCANFIMVTACLNLLLLAVCVGQAFGARLPGCSDRLAVDETSNTVITCDQFGDQDTVTWLLKAKPPQDDVSLGSCSPQGPCTQASRYSLTRSSTQSTVTITPSSDLRSIASYRIQCDASGTTTSCALDVFYPPVVPAQNCRVEARSGSWTFDGSCNITKTFSSMNSYQCQVFTGTSQSSQPTHVRLVPFTLRPHSNASYRTGSCSFSSNFTSLLSGITSRQDFYFRFNVFPGPTRRVTGPVTLERPVSPTIRCPDIVAENTTFTCTCSTTNLGQPAGRLVWSRVSGGIIKEGEYDVTTLTLPSQTLTRHDQGVNKFRCDVRWTAGNYTAAYTGNIGFPPSQTVLRVNSTTPGQTMTVSENDDVSLNCTATGGNPESTLTLSDAKSTITTGLSPLIHHLGKAQCQHSGDYTCTANNGYGDSVTSSRNVYVNCSPRGHEEVGKINFIRDPVSVVFDVTAYPVPVTGNFTYMGSSPSNAFTRAVDSSFAGIQLSGGCVQKGSVVYQYVCTVTVSNLTKASAAGFYQVAVANAHGSRSFKFQVIFKGNDMTTDQDSTQPSSYLGGIIGLAVVLAVMVIAAVAGVVWLWRRQWHLPCTDHKLLQNSGPESSFATSEPDPSPGLHPAVTEDIQGVDPRGPYDSLQMSDVGLRSVYSQIDQTQRRSDTEPVPDPTYQNTVQ